ncbi:MAG: phosphoesterase [Desulfurococcales archaeon]|nr:phosphoesterase [Desulfurococcales archaeon]
MVSGKERRVLILADWDADGVISAALVGYAQEVKGRFPVQERLKPDMLPVGPRSIQETVEDLLEREGCWEHVVLLDIPYTEAVEAALKLIKEKCGSKIYYFDHHSSTVKNITHLEDEYNAYVVVGRSSTSVIVARFLEGLGVRVSPRLRDFAKAVGVLEGGARKLKGDVSDGLVGVAASISKSLNQMRSPDAWLRYVKWLMNPIPIEPARIDIGGEKRDLVSYGMEVSKQNDTEIKKVATELAMSARNLGFIRFVDARDKWKRRGSSALTSAIYKILNTPVAALFEKEDGTRILIIRAGEGMAASIMDVLSEMEVVEEPGGHGNIAVAKLKDEVTVKRLEESLRRAAFEASRRRFHHA